MNKKFMTPLVFVVITSIFVFTGLGYGNINNKAKELGKKELSKYLVECNKVWYIQPVTRGGPVELRRKGSIGLNVIPLTESDLETQMDKVSYVMGHNIANNFKDQKINIQIDAFIQGIRSEERRVGKE